MTRPLRTLATLALLGAVLAACSNGANGTGVDGPLPSPVEGTVAPTRATNEPTASGSPAIDTPAPSSGLTQTDTEWGRIWDGLPASFPTIAGATPSDEAGDDGPVSATFSVPGGDPADIAGLLQTELEIATYSTEALSGPLEDGSFVLDSVGEGDCRIQTSVRPAGDSTLVAIRYGAACPAQ